MKKSLVFVFILAGFASLAQDLTSDLKVCMPFTGNTNDYSGNMLHGAASSVTLTTDRFGNANSAYRFHRNNDSHVAINSFSAIAPTNELSISIWAKADIITSSCLFTLDPDNMQDRCVGCAQYLVGGNNTMIVWDYGHIISGGRVTVQNIAADTVNWHHYVYIISQSANLKQIYKDGVNISNTPYTLSCTNKNHPVFIGGNYSNNTTSKIFWTGKIDDVCMYNRALSALDVTALYNALKLCDFPTGIEDLKLLEKFQVYPVPSNDGFFKIMNPGGQAAKIEVHAADGRLVFSGSSQAAESSVDLSGCARGVYMLTISSGEERFVKKLIRE